MRKNKSVMSWSYCKLKQEDDTLHMSEMDEMIVFFIFFAISITMMKRLLFACWWWSMWKILLIKSHNGRQGYFLTLQVSILGPVLFFYIVFLFRLNCQQLSVGKVKEKKSKKKAKRKHWNRNLYGAQQRTSHLFKMQLPSENVMKSLAHNFILFPVCLHFAVWIILKRALNNALILCSVMELSNIVSGEGEN